VDEIRIRMRIWGCSQIGFEQRVVDNRGCKVSVICLVYLHPPVEGPFAHLCVGYGSKGSNKRRVLVRYFTYLHPPVEGPFAQISKHLSSA